MTAKTTPKRTFQRYGWSKDKSYTASEKLVLAQLSRKEYTWRSIEGIVEEVAENGLDSSAVSRILSGLCQSGVARQGNSKPFGVVYALVERVGAS